ncbi:MAG: GtrA family protein [Terriglobia bacterium]
MTAILRAWRRSAGSRSAGILPALFDFKRAAGWKPALRHRSNDYFSSLRKVSAPAQLRRWIAFNLVGGLGILVQLAILAALTAGVGLHYLLATGLAVEAAVLHNFVWHERWTWRDRANHDKPGRWQRLGRFQITNGALSVGGNLVLMQVLVGAWAMNYTLANVVSITLCSVLNFLASDRLVFRPTRAADRSLGA